MACRTCRNVSALLGLLAVAGLLPISPSQGLAENFRVENEIYIGKETEPQSKSTTIFYEGLVYDFLEKPQETTVLDLARKRFVLLDPASQQRTEVSTVEILALTEKLKTLAADQTSTFTRFLSDPKFEVRTDEKTEEVVFDSPWIVYRVTGSLAPSQEMARQYRDFSDWHLRLNTRLVPGYKQTFARLAVNESLAAQQLIPTKVHLTIKSRLPFQEKTAWSQHKLVPRLMQSDRDRLAKTDRDIGAFKTVSFDEYMKRGQ